MRLAGSAVGGQDNLVAWETWTRKRKIGRLKESRSIPARTVSNLTNAWYFAAQGLGLNFNLFVTVRPKDIDSLTPRQRITRWEEIRNKIAQFARDHGYECVLIWARESDPGTGRNEHLHVLRACRKLVTLTLSSSPATLQLFLPRSIPSTAIDINFLLSSRSPQQLSSAGEGGAGHSIKPGCPAITAPALLTGPMNQ